MTKSDSSEDREDIALSEKTFRSRTENNDLILKEAEGDRQEVTIESVPIYPEDKSDLDQCVKVLETKLFKRRWLILLVFVLYASSSFMQWFQYSIISNVIEDYYQVSPWAVKMTSMIFMMTYLPLAFPVSYVMDNMDLRKSALIGSIGTALGSWIKVFSVEQNRFFVTFTGQTVTALSQLFILNVPPKIAAVWFGQSEVSTACSIAIYGSQFGIASGFFFAPLLVTSSSDLENIGNDLFRMFIYIAVFASVMALSVYFVFEAEPSIPPSPAQAILRVSPPPKVNYLRGLKHLLISPAFMLLVTSNGLNNGCFSAMSTMFNHIFLFYFPNGEVDPGTIGVIIVVGGMIGSVICGTIMDKTKKYKEVAFVVYLLAALVMIGYSYSLMTNYYLIIYSLAWILGFFLLGYTPVGYEFGSELTYPESEVTVAAILNIMNMLAGIILTVFFELTLQAFGEFWSNMTAVASLFLGTFLTALIKSDLKRQRAQMLPLEVFDVK